MSNKCLPIVVLILFSVHFVSYSTVGGKALAADDLAGLEAALKQGNTTKLKEIRSQLRDSKGVGSVKGDAMVAEIYGRHCRSLIKEALYHMGRLAPYHDYERAYKIKKLKSLKELNRRFQAGEITKSEFEHSKLKIEEVYRSDIEDAKDFIGYKVERLREIVTLVSENVEDINAMGNEQLPEGIRKSILELKADPVWQDFVSDTERGRHIRDVIAKNSGGTGLITQLEAMFKPFERISPDAPVIPTWIIDEVVAQYE